MFDENWDKSSNSFMMRMIIPEKKTAIFLVLTALLTAFYIKDCHAGAVVLDSMGVVSSGRGGANITHADNGIVMHDNPAVLLICLRVNGLKRLLNLSILKSSMKIL